MKLKFYLTPCIETFVGLVEQCDGNILLKLLDASCSRNKQGT